MRRFKKKSGFHMVILPGHGPVKDDRVFEGEEYAKFSPHILEELPAAVLQRLEPEPVPEVVEQPKPTPAPVAETPVVKTAPVTPPPDKMVDAGVLAQAEKDLRALGVHTNPIEDALDVAEASVPQMKRKPGRPRKGR